MRYLNLNFTVYSYRHSGICELGRNVLEPCQYSILSSVSWILESEANDWAHNALVDKCSWAKFLAKSPRSANDVQDFTNEQEIAPGIVVGMLQHEGH